MNANETLLLKDEVYLVVGCAASRLLFQAHEGTLKLRSPELPLAAHTACTKAVPVSHLTTSQGLGAGGVRG